MYTTSYYKPYWANDDGLEHYGVLGMKWGIRRYQNADGTLTEAGKKRYAGATKEQIETSERRKAKVVKAAKTGAKVARVAALTLAGGVGLKTVAEYSGLITAGSRALTKALSISDGMTYNNIKSIDAQKLEQVLRGTSNGYSFRNLQSESAQKMEQYLRKYAR